MKKPGIYDEFEYAGHWWLPENPDNKVSGTLIFSKDGIKLELIGLIDNIHLDGDNYPKLPVLFGECEAGPITLINGFENNNRAGYIVTSILVFNKMIVGKHINSLDNFLLTNLTITLTNLESWLKYHPFEVDYTEETQICKVIKEPLVEVFVKEINATIKSNYQIISNYEIYKGVAYKYTPELKIVSKEPKSLKWFEKIANSLKNLLSILMNNAVFIESISFKEQENHRPIQVYTYPFKNYRKEKINGSQGLNFDLPKINGDIEKILNNWFESKIETSHQNYIKNIFDSNTLILEDIFLNYAKAIESFHRDLSSESGKFVEDVEYKKIVEKMICSIKGEADTNLISKLQGTLKYANEYGFQRRIKEVLRMLPDDVKKLVLAGQSIKDMADQIRNNRDYYTHFGEKPIDYYSLEQLQFINARLKVVVIYSFLNDLGIPKDLIIKGIMEEYSYLGKLEMNKEY